MINHESFRQLSLKRHQKCIPKKGYFLHLLILLPLSAAHFRQAYALFLGKFLQIFDILIRRQTLGSKLVTVTTTPNGYADGIAKKEGTEYFVMPEESFMSFNSFLDELDHKRFVNFLQNLQNIF